MQTNCGENSSNTPVISSPEQGIELLDSEHNPDVLFEVEGLELFLLVQPQSFKKLHNLVGLLRQCMEGLRTKAIENPDADIRKKEILLAAICQETLQKIWMVVMPQPAENASITNAEETC